MRRNRCLQRFAVGSMSGTSKPLARTCSWFGILFRAGSPRSSSYPESNVTAFPAQCREWGRRIAIENQSSTFCLVKYCSTMLFETWEKLRGIDLWTETDARVLSAPMFVDGRQAGAGVSRSEIRIGWQDQAGKRFRAKFMVRDSSPLFQLYQGKTLTIRYNPRKPSSFYVRDLLRYRIREFLVYLTFAAVSLALFSGLSWLRRHGLK